MNIWPSSPRPGQEPARIAAPARLAGPATTGQTSSFVNVPTSTLVQVDTTHRGRVWCDAVWQVAHPHPLS
jgi:hypothetical protein